MKLTPVVISAFLLSFAASGAAQQAGDHSAIEQGLEISVREKGPAAQLDLAAAMSMLKIPSAGVALIDGGKLSWAHNWGPAPPRTLYQAASLSKLVTAVAALRLVELGRLGLDRNVNDDLIRWRVPDSGLTRGHPVSLRGLLSMTAGVYVPGYLGYEPGAPLPSLIEILHGKPPAKSPPVRAVYQPGSRYVYSGGGYEIVQALIEDKSNASFDAALRQLVFEPLGMMDSTFAQPLTRDLAARAEQGHYRDGRTLPGGWRVLPELAAAGLWSTPADLAKLLIEIASAYRGKESLVLTRKMAIEMLTPQNGGPYGLGGAVAGSGTSLVLMKRGQNIGYQAYMLVFPAAGQGIAVMTDSDNGTTLASALIRRAAAVYGWPPLGALSD